MRSMDPTDVPPNFCTMSATKRSGYGLKRGTSTVGEASARESSLRRALQPGPLRGCSAQETVPVPVPVPVPVSVSVPVPDFSGNGNVYGNGNGNGNGNVYGNGNGNAYG